MVFRWRHFNQWSIHIFFSEYLLHPSRVSKNQMEFSLRIQITKVILLTVTFRALLFWPLGKDCVQSTVFFNSVTIFIERNGFTKNVHFCLDCTLRIKKSTPCVYVITIFFCCFQICLHWSSLIVALFLYRLANRESLSHVVCSNIRNQFSFVLLLLRCRFLFAVVGYRSYCLQCFFFLLISLSTVKCACVCMFILWWL